MLSVARSWPIADPKGLMSFSPACIPQSKQSTHESPLLSPVLTPIPTGDTLILVLQTWKLRLRKLNDLPKVTQGAMERALQPTTPQPPSNWSQEAKCGPGLTGSRGPGGSPG